MIQVLLIFRTEGKGRRLKVLSFDDTSHSLTIFIVPIYDVIHRAGLTQAQMSITPRRRTDHSLGQTILVIDDTLTSPGDFQA